MRLVFSQLAFKQFTKLSQSIQDRINDKLDFYLSQENPLKFAEKLTEHEVGEWRFRIGDYRVIFDAIDDKIIILKVGHRKDIYK